MTMEQKVHTPFTHTITYFYCLSLTSSLFLFCTLFRGLLKGFFCLLFPVFSIAFFRSQILTLKLHLAHHTVSVARWWWCWWWCSMQSSDRIKLQLFADWISFQCHTKTHTHITKARRSLLSNSQTPIGAKYNVNESKILCNFFVHFTRFPEKKKRVYSIINVQEKKKNTHTSYIWFVVILDFQKTYKQKPS